MPKKINNREVPLTAAIHRIEELTRLVNDSIAILLTNAPEGYKDSLAKNIEDLLVYLEADRICIRRAGKNEGTPGYFLLNAWVSPDAVNDEGYGKTPVAAHIPMLAEWDAYLTGGEHVNKRACDFPPPVREWLGEQNVKSILAFPVFLQEMYWGYVSFENCRRINLRTRTETIILKPGSLMLASALERNLIMMKHGERLAQQQLMSSISKGFITKDHIDDQIRSALAKTGEFLNVMRVLIAVFIKDTEVSRPYYFWCSDPKYKPNQSKRGFSKIIKELFPRYHDDADENPTIYCDNTLEYEGGRYAIFYERGGIKSFICAPIYIDGEIWGVISIEDHENNRVWNENDAQLVSTVSSALSNAVARDIMERERKSALDQAVMASRAKGDFLSSMSHEIRTPINAIIGMTTIGKSSRTAERKDYALDKIDNASKHLLGVINDILDMSKIEANKLELSPTEFDFEEMLRKVVNVISFKADEKTQRLYINIGRDIPKALIGDDQRLAQVITNLLSNAVKFTPDGGAVRLSASLVSEENGMCRVGFTVADTGIGISDEQKARLFKSFTQADAGISRKYGGTGLGLTISKRIVELMDGEINVESEIGSGSKFIFSAILRRAPGSGAGPASFVAGINGMRVFAADGDPEIVGFFEDVCGGLGIRCCAAQNAEEAAEALAANDGCDLFFLNWKLPGISGMDLIREVRERHADKPVVIIFSSADWSAIEDEAHEAGVERFLSKPLFRSSVEELICECAGRGKATEAACETGESEDFTGRTVLLAEDLEINREIVTALLEPTGVSVEWAEDGARALAMFGADPERYDMILMDVQMPEMDGCEATRRIRGMGAPRAGEVPIIAMTANVFREDIDRCLESGMNGHVGKPIDFDELIASLKKYLAK